MHFLVTRPIDDARELQSQLNALGHQATLAPMMKLTLRPRQDLNIASFAGLIITSRNALRSLAKSNLNPADLLITVYAVGPTTADQAKGLGFQTVITGPGNGEGLTSLVAETSGPDQGPLLYLTGQTLAFDCQQALNAKRFDVHREIVYQTEAAQSLPEAAIRAFHDGAIDAVIVMSPRSAATYSKLMQQTGLGPQAEQIPTFCLSEKVARGLSFWPRDSLFVARHPNTEEMLALIARFAPKY
jgi:uroporphyrinogen-III synthase